MLTSCWKSAFVFSVTLSESHESGTQESVLSVPNFCQAGITFEIGFFERHYTYALTCGRLLNYLHSQSVSLEHVLLRRHVNEGEADAEVVQRLAGTGTEGLHILPWRVSEDRP